MNHNGLLIRVVVEDDDLQQPARTIRSDDEISSFTWNHPQWIADGMLDVLIADAVLSRAVGDLH